MLTDPMLQRQSRRLQTKRYSGQRTFTVANRNWQRKQALEKEVKELYAKVAIGASGAPTISSAYGIASVARVSTGLYRITLSDSYASLKHVEAIVLHSTAADHTFQVKLETVATTKLVELFVLTGGSVADPADGSSLLIKLELKNTTII